MVIVNYFITVKDVYDAIYYVKAESRKQALIKLADYFGTHIKFLDKIIEELNLDDIVSLFRHYGLDISTFLEVSSVSTWFGSTAEDHIITIID